MTEEELIARSREVGAELRRRPGDLDRLAGALLAELAERLDSRPVADVIAWCKGCRRGTASVPCPRCDGPACAGCGRCPPCDGPVPDEEEK
jgi:hypothetical protein